MKSKEKPTRRNPLAALALFRKAGAHGKSGKAQRREDKMELLRTLRSGDRRDKDGGSGVAGRGDSSTVRVCESFGPAALGRRGDGFGRGLSCRRSVSQAPTFVGA